MHIHIVGAIAHTISFGAVDIYMVPKITRQSLHTKPPTPIILADSFTSPLSAKMGCRFCRIGWYTADIMYCYSLA